MSPGLVRETRDPRRRFLCRGWPLALAILLVLSALAPAVPRADAQPDQITAAVVREAHGFIMEYALLQDAGAPIVGLPTYGKITVQGITIPPLPGGWGLRLTTARYLTRPGGNIDGTGLIPTLVVPMDPILVQAPGDVQSREALALARTRLPSRASP